MNHPQEETATSNHTSGANEIPITSNASSGASRLTERERIFNLLRVSDLSDDPVLLWKAVFLLAIFSNMRYTWNNVLSLVGSHRKMYRSYKQDMDEFVNKLKDSIFHVGDKALLSALTGVHVRSIKAQLVKLYGKTRPIFDEGPAPSRSIKRVREEAEVLEDVVPGIVQPSIHFSCPPVIAPAYTLEQTRKLEHALSNGMVADLKLILEGCRLVLQHQQQLHSNVIWRLLVAGGLGTESNLSSCLGGALRSGDLDLVKELLRVGVIMSPFPAGLSTHIATFFPQTADMPLNIPLKRIKVGVYREGGSSDSSPPESDASKDPDTSSSNEMDDAHDISPDVVTSDRQAASADIVPVQGWTIACFPQRIIRKSFEGD